MRIKKIKSQHRRDFVAIFECEHCGNSFEDTGYDDTYFHDEVVPSMICSQCNKQADGDYRAYSPRYADGVQL